MRFLFLIFFLLFSFGNTASIKSRISHGGLHFLKKIGREMASDHIQELSIPEKTFSFSMYKGTMKKTEIRGFDMPEFDFDFDEDVIVLKSNGGSVQVSAEIESEIDFLFGTHTMVWDLSAEISSLDSRHHLGFVENTANLTMIHEKCDVFFGEMDINLSGGFLASIVNLLTKVLKPLLRTLAEDKTCELIQTVISEEINPKLAAISKRIPIGDELPVNVEFQNVRTKVARNSLEVEADTKILFDESPCHAPSVVPFPESNDATGMFTTWVSESVFKCIFSVAYEANQMKFHLDENRPEAAKYLSTVCSGDADDKCIGSIFPEIRDLLGETTVEIKVEVENTPDFELHVNEMRTSFALRLQVFHRQKILVDLGLQIGITGAFFTEDKKIIGEFYATTSNIHLESSEVGEISSDRFNGLQTLLDNAFNKGLRRLGKGTPFPAIMGMELDESSKISIEEGFLRSDIDLVLA